MSTMIAVRTAPPVVCPDWCTVDTEDHLADLRDWEGYVIHWSGDSTGVRHSEYAFVDGAPEPSEPPLVFVDAPVTSLGLDAAEKLARAILAAVQEARA